MDDKKHRQPTSILKILGVIFATGGLICAIIGFADFFRAFGGEGMPKLFFLCFIGFPMLFVGIVCLTFGFRKEITRYVKNESVPVINEAGEELQPAVRAVTRAVKEGLTEENGALRLRSRERQRQQILQRMRKTARCDMPRVRRRKRCGQ